MVKLVKETPEARKTRVSSGVKYRSVVFRNKKKDLLNSNKLAKEAE